MWFKVIFWSLLIALVVSLDTETRFWVVIAWLAFGAGLAFVGRLGIWAVFHFGSQGKLKVTLIETEEKVKCHYSDCEERGDRVEEGEQVTCPTCRNDLGLELL